MDQLPTPLPVLGQTLMKILALRTAGLVYSLLTKDPLPDTFISFLTSFATEQFPSSNFGNW